MLFPKRALAIVPFVSSVNAATARRSQQGGVQVATVGGRQECTVAANGGNVSDVSNIVSAFDMCGHGGNIVFPEDQNYYIAEKLNPVVNDVRIEWRGIWTVAFTLFLSNISTLY